ncbi:hypothetical protein DFH06DRAFT_1422671, partial [Mycena polygramma]
TPTTLGTPHAVPQSLPTDSASDATQDQPLDVGATVKEMWEDAAKAFESTCGQSLLKGEVKNFDDLQKKIESTRDLEASLDDEGKKGIQEKTKKLGLELLKYLRVLVEVATEASSLIPSPEYAVKIVSNVLCFVFDTPEAIKGYREAIDQVFSDVSSALSQFHIYASIEHFRSSSLIHQIHLVMVSFIKLSAHVVKYRQGGRADRFIHQLKFVLRDDSGLAKEMDKFRQALQQQRDVEGTVTLAVAVETRNNVFQIDEKLVGIGKTTEETRQGVSAIKDNFDRLEQLNKIRDALSLPETPPADVRTTLSERCLDGTGTWIWSHSAYTAWTAKDTQNPHILFLTGPPSSGKSSVAALIAQRLKVEQKSRTYVAHHFFGAGSRKSGEKNPVLSALKHLAFQIAKVDPTVRKALSKACETWSDSWRRSENLETLWGELRIGTPGSSATYYLVFDGLENLSDDQAKKLISFIVGPKLTGESAGRVRVLASWTDEQFDNFRTNMPPSPPQIRMVEHNGQDMQLVIEKTLTEHKLLQDAKPDSIQQRARDKLFDKLPQSVRGSYSLLQFKLDEAIRVLSMRSSSEALDSVLNQSISSQEGAVKNLQRSLADDEISELNELLKWVLYSLDGWMMLDELEAAMFLFSRTEYLVPLQYIIETKYSSLLKIEDNYVYSQDGLKEYLEKEKVSSSQASYSKKSISMTITIKDVDQEICGNFLWDLAHKAIREKFSFDFATASPNTLSISVDEFESHHTILKQAFEYLGKDPEEQTDSIGPYLVSCLPLHLARLRDLEDQDVAALKPSEQFEIGQNLWRLFKDAEIFQRHKAVFEQVFWTADDMESVKRWLMDSAIVRRLEDKTWRDEVQRATPTRGFMRPLVGIVARGFLRERSWNAENAYDWIKELMSFDQNLQQPVEPAKPDDGVSEASSSSVSWDDVSAWCRDILEMPPDSELDSLWYERLAEAASLQGSNADTLLLYCRAIEKGNPSWLCHRGLGRTYFDERRIAEAIAEMELALKEADREGATPKPEEKDIVELHLLLGQYNFKAGCAQTAEEHYKVVRNSKDAEQARLGELGYLKAKLSRLDSKGTMELLKDTLADDGVEAKMNNVLQMIALDDKHNILISKIFTAAKADPDVLKRIVRVMEAATAAPTSSMPATTKTVGDEARGVLLYDRGVAAYRYKVSSGTDQIVAALRLWKESCEVLGNVGGRNACIVRESAINALALHYFQSALEPHKGSDVGVHIKALAQLAKDESKDGYVSDLRTLLGALHACRREKQEAHTALAMHVRFALQILSDDITENDMFGFMTMWKTLLHYRDFTNAAFALSLVGQPDLLTEALHGLRETIKTDLVAQQYRDMVDRLATETIKIAKDKVPDAAQQIQRIEAAKAHIDNNADAQEPAAAVAAKEFDEGSDGGSKAPESETKDRDTAIHALYDCIDALQRRHTPQIDTSDCAFWTCDGLTPDGEKCENLADFKHVFYHCVYCWNRDFCSDCLERLRKPDSGADITACSASHKWIQIPQQGGDMYVGRWAESARMPREVQPVKGLEHILEVVYDEDGGHMVTLAAWKEALTREWG